MRQPSARRRRRTRVSRPATCYSRAPDTYPADHVAKRLGTMRAAQRQMLDAGALIVAIVVALAVTKEIAATRRALMVHHRQGVRIFEGIAELHSQRRLVATAALGVVSTCTVPSPCGASTGWLPHQTKQTGRGGGEAKSFRALFFPWSRAWWSCSTGTLLSLYRKVHGSHHARVPCAVRWPFQGVRRFHAEAGARGGKPQAGHRPHAKVVGW